MVHLVVVNSLSQVPRLRVCDTSTCTLEGKLERHVSDQVLWFSS